jgi:large subunit ribosomal protein L24e
MVTCSFCKENIARGTGKMLVLKSGKILNFCGNKCEKNMIQLKRKPADMKWSGFYVKGGQKKKEL